MEIEKYIVESDAGLVRLVLEGDNTSFECLFNRYRDSIYQYYAQRIGASDDLDDLLQEIFIKVFINMERYDEQYTFGQWIYAIARNTFIDYVRKRRDNISIDLLPSSVPAPPATAPSPEEKIIGMQQRAQIELYLQKLTPQYRKLIELRFMKEYSYEEIASALAIPIGTVKTQIHRARAQLCHYITESGIL